MPTYSQKMPHLLQKADNKIMTNSCLLPLMELVVTQFLMILDYMCINVYFKKNLKITLQLSRKRTTSQELTFHIKLQRLRLFCNLISSLHLKF